ncbi:MAG TPA: PEP-CTERM sorting domain-containing protein [Tepidisphaeraceae bacterium]|jgi:hypothetical protein
MKWTAVLALFAGALLVSAAEAATITYTLSQNNNGTGTVTPGSFAVFATVSNDNGGLAGFAFNVSDTTSITNRSPLATFVNSSFTVRQAGFSLFRADAAEMTGATTGAQDNTSATGIITFGIGQTPGDLKTQAPAGFAPFGPNAESVYGVPVLLAVGTFASGTTPTLVTGIGTVFADTTSNEVVSADNIVLLNNNIAIPEPASLAVVLGGGVALLARRRKIA